MTTIHLVRHAAHGLLPHTLAGRMPGVPLSAEGVAQARRLAQHFAGRPIAAVVSSPVQRARETAGPIAEACGHTVGIDPGLEEIDFGIWTGRRIDALTDDPAWQAWNQARHLAACPGGETMHAAQSRVLAALTRLRDAHGEAEIVAVSHADVIKSVLAAFLGCALDRLHCLVIDPASVSTVLLGDAFAQVECVNYR